MAQPSSTGSEHGPAWRMRQASGLRLTPAAAALAAVLLAGGGLWQPQAHAASAGAAWMAAGGSQVQQARRVNPAAVTAQARAQRQQQQARNTLSRSVENLNRTANAIAVQQATQARARAQAKAGPAGVDVPDGLVRGGVWDRDAQGNQLSWRGAERAREQKSGNQATVNIKQTESRAILNWETFNVGRDTTVNFEQQADWAALNRVNDPNGRPSQIQGSIKGNGTVMVVNRNGVVFSGTSQVNVRNLVASAVGMTDAQFDKGIFSDALGSGHMPSFANDLTVSGGAANHAAATGDITVQAGANIATHQPVSVTQGGGYVLMLGRNVDNAGHISTPGGQTALAAGDAFVIRKGTATDANQNSSTRGNLVTASRSAATETDALFQVRNTGLIEARTGDITLTAENVRQEGVLVSTTSVHTRGTIHLLGTSAPANSTSATGVTLARDSVTAIVLDESATTALDVQREAQIKESATQGDGEYHRRDQSLIQINSASNVDFLGDSLALATGGQILVQAAGRSELHAGAQVDVSGHVGVRVAMEANNVEINVQGNEQRDSPGNRDDKSLNNRTIWLDRRSLVLVPAGTNGYETDRWYTAGGLLEVGGYLGITGHGIGEWSAQGGTVRFGGAELITRAGSVVNLSGGTLDVQDGYVYQTFLKGADGRVYLASRAPADMLYTGIYNGYEVEHLRWGITRTFHDLLAPGQRREAGYTVGRDAGQLIVATAAASLAGDVEAKTFQGESQTQGRDAALDGYLQAQTARARNGQLIVGTYVPVYDKTLRSLLYTPDAVAGRVAIGKDEGQEGIVLDAGWLNGLDLGELRVYAKDGVQVDEAVQVADGGTIALHGSAVNVDAGLTARSGNILLGNVVEQWANARWESKAIGPVAGAATVIAEGVKLDASGVWSNLFLDQLHTGGLPYVGGGDIRIASSGKVVVGKHALLDASSGAALLSNGTVVSGHGGDIALLADVLAGVVATDSSTLELAGELRSLGGLGGGKLVLQTGGAVVVGGLVAGSDGTLSAGQDSLLDLFTQAELVVAEGAVLPLDYHYTRSHAQPGEALGSLPLVNWLDPNSKVTLAADWVLPKLVLSEPNYSIRIAGGRNISISPLSDETIIPAGTVIDNIGGAFPVHYVLPADVFPNGLAITPVAATVRAGQLAPREVRYAAGTLLPAGTVLLQDIAVAAPFHLDGNVFRQGFSSYEVAGHRGLAVAEGAQIKVEMPLWQVDLAAARELASGTSLDAVLQSRLSGLFMEQANSGKLKQRPGADLTLRSGFSALSDAGLAVGLGADISLDPGRAVTLLSNGQVTVNGSIRASGGSIDILNFGYPDAGPNAKGHERSIWIGSTSILDVAGLSHTAVDRNGRRYGKVMAGGSIRIGGKYEANATHVDAVDAFVVIRPGAKLDVSGSSSVLDLPGAENTAVASAGGLIYLSSFNGLFIDGEMRAHAGGAGVAGGTLALALESPNYASSAVPTDRVRAVRELLLAREQGASVLSETLLPGQVDAGLNYGYGRIGVDRIRSGGFDNLGLLVNGILAVEPAVDLSLGQSLRLAAGSVSLALGADSGAAVTLAAPYVRLAGATRGQRDHYVMPYPRANGVPTVLENTSLTVRSSLLDVMETVSFGTSGLSKGTSGDVEVLRHGFQTVELRSQGDLRLLGSVVRDRTSLDTSGSLLLAAQQIYPVSHARAEIRVGRVQNVNQWGGTQQDYDPDAVLRIERVGDVIPAMPYSVFGSLTFMSANIEQAGVLRAPLGGIVLGHDMGSNSLNVSRLVLLPGSETSVSAAGLIMPYGGSVDGLTYVYNGADAVYSGLGGQTNGIVGVSLRSDDIQVQPGAVIDLRGGGELTGAAFLAGRGGSTDARLNPLLQVAVDGSGFDVPGLSSNPVYAIVPGVQQGYAPVAAENGAGDPMLGQQVTIGDGIPGLPPGTYTLLPSNYALLPGAFRVELNGVSTSPRPFGSLVNMRNGSFATNARMSIADTSLVDAATTQVILTPADTLRRYSQYNEISYARFGLEWAERDGAPRPMLERDAASLILRPGKGKPDIAHGVQIAPGTVRLAAEAGGYGSQLVVVAGSGSIEILGQGKLPTEGFDGVSLYADTLNSVGAATMVIGGTLQSEFVSSTTLNTQNASRVNFGSVYNAANSVTLRDGALLSAAQVFLVAGRVNGGITVEEGAGINTLGQGAVGWDSRSGYVFAPGKVAVLAVSNGWLEFQAPEATSGDGYGAGQITLGACAATGCTHETPLFAEGTITAVTESAFRLGDSVRYGARNLVLAVGAINVGDAAALAEAAAHGVLPPGLTLNQQVLDRLLLGDTSNGAPALENLVLTARDAVNFHGSVVLSTLNPETGISSLERLVLTTPAIHGSGSASDVARIETSILVWNGSAQAPGPGVAGGVGTGRGRLVVDADVIELGYGPRSQPDTVGEHGRRTLGFGTVELNARERLTSNHKGSLAVYQSQGVWDDAAKSYVYHGGDLLIRTPLLTGQAGSVTRIRAGGAIQALAPAGHVGTQPDNAVLTDALGAELAFQAGAGLTLDTAVLLPSGKLTLAAQGDVQLNDGAQIDLAGRRLFFYDVEKYSWGGDLGLESLGGNILQSEGARILMNAEFNRAGKLSVSALATTGGRVDLRGMIVGQSSGHYDAGGTMVPFASGYADIRSQRIEDFAGLNSRLTEGGFFGGRSFQLASGSLVIGNELKAREINVSVDQGSLTVNGTVDASGEQVGSIRLYAGRGVTLAGTAVLNAGASVLRKDSYGQVIEAPNRAVIEVGSGTGKLVIGSGAQMLLGVAGAPAAYGTVTLNAPRLGGATGNDVDIDASGSIGIEGARSLFVNAFQRYDDAKLGTDKTVSGRDYQVIDQAYLDGKHKDSVKFIDQALVNGSLMDGKLAGLRVYRDQFHLRPGVEIASATGDGDLHIDGDINLSGHRYASVNPHSLQSTAVHGSGEAGALVLRASGNLEIFGSLTDGFDASRLTLTADDNGWVLPAGRLPFGGDIFIPQGGLVTLASGTVFQAGRTLNYAIPTPALTLPAGLELPVDMVLNQALTLAAGTVVGANVSDGNGNILYAIGMVLEQAVQLPSGTTLGAGFRLASPTQVMAASWPGGVPLPVAVTLGQDIALKKGAIVPSETDVVLPNGAELVNLRPVGEDGTQGRTWALAPMLAAGSHSWDMRLVAGADLGAADTRLTTPHDEGTVRLADPHFGLVLERTAIPGTGTPDTYKWTTEVDSETLVSYFGVEAESGESISQETIDLLASWGYFANSVLELNEWGLGELVLLDQQGQESEYAMVAKPVRQQLFSVLRTGTGDLDVLAAADFEMTSPFGVYTAGTASNSVAPDAADPYNQKRGVLEDGTVLWVVEGGDFEKLVNGGSDSLYSAWYPEQGGNVLLRVGGDMKGDLIGQNNKSIRPQFVLGKARQQIASMDTGSWLWRQGTGSLESGTDGVPTSWWVNFGTYVAGPADMVRDLYAGWLYGNAPFLTGFTGVGTLGGGNLVVESGGNAGMLDIRGDAVSSTAYAPRSQGLHLVVGSTGRVLPDGTLTQTGGGDLDIRIGGGLNTNPQLQGNSQDLSSTFVNLRGALNLEAGSIGGVKLRYGVYDHLDTRGGEIYSAGRVFSGGGPVLVLGDAAARLDSRGDLVLAGVSDPGRARLYNATPFDYLGNRYNGQGWSWFSLWSPATAVDLFSAGGNLTPTTAWADGGSHEDVHQAFLGHNTSPTMDGGHFYPSVLRASAANGSIYYGVGTTALHNSYGSTPLRTQYGLTLAPSPVGEQFVNETGRGELELLAQQSIYASGYSITASTADPVALSSPFRPGFVGMLAYRGGGQAGNLPVAVTTVDAEMASRSDWVVNVGGRTNNAAPFTHGTSANTGYAVPGQSPARYYAVDGDIVSLRFGNMVGLGYPAGTLGYRYEGSIPVAVRAGRDLTNSGTRLGERDSVKDTKGNLISHGFATDVSVVEAGRDIRESSFYITGPGVLDVAAGRNLYFADKGEITSLGDILRAGGDSRAGGASIAISAGIGAGAQWAAFAARYLDPENQANTELPFADQPGKALVVYSGELTLAQWLRREYGFQGDDSQAEAFLAAKQQELDQHYRAQLAAGRSAATRSLARDYRLESQLYLVNWLNARFGPETVSGPARVSNGTQQVYEHVSMDAREFFATLAPEQQRAYLRTLYYAELKASGREYTDAVGKRFGSYLRGREAVATLLPTHQDDGSERVYQGDLTLFSSALYYDDWAQSNGVGKNRPTPGKTYVTRAEWQAQGGTAAYGVSFYDVSDAGLHTNFGGDISILVPGGRTLVGVDGGFTPGAGSGVITQGEGDISIFSRDSILMGQSRIFTTFGGNILAWSARGDINAGRGSKTTVVYTPQRRAYDMFGNVTLSPTTPSTGAGIATLNPIPEIPAGDIDLIAPEGVIDAGEAGIRVSGNVNLAAMRVVNAENIQVQGESTGMPVVASVNVGALTSASSAASSAASTAQDTVQRARNASRQNLPSVISVQILGFGDDGSAAGSTPAARPASPQAAARPASYLPRSSVVVLGVGADGPTQREHLSAQERAQLGG